MFEFMLAIAYVVCQGKQVNSLKRTRVAIRLVMVHRPILKMSWYQKMTQVLSIHLPTWRIPSNPIILLLIWWATTKMTF